LSQEKSLISPGLRRKIGQAMGDYMMLTDGDRVLCAVSGGIDSLVLVRILQLWQKKAPLSYTVHGIHIDMQQ
jgi:tRNA 2-thiocytidine biosynthesis protein TtcA